MNARVNFGAATRLGALLFVGVATIAASADEDGSAAKAVADSAAAEFEQLGVEYDRLTEARDAALPSNDGAALSDANLSDEEWLKQLRAEEAAAPDPDAEILPRLLAFAKSHPDAPLALDALAFIIRRGGAQSIDVLGAPWRVKEDALDVVMAQHMANPRVAQVLDILGGSLPSQKSEALLRAATESEDARLAATATYSLARYLATTRVIHERSAKLGEKTKLANFERYWKIVLTPYVAKNFPLDTSANEAEIERLLAQVSEKYADIPVDEWHVTEAGIPLFHPEPYSPPKTFGQLAKSMLFELQHLQPGKPAPDIEGVDAEGEHFRLSDYGGKVVLLTFSANWCGPCLQLYPMERSLIKKYHGRPFVLLSVNCDDTIEALQASMKSGEVTWRSWFDGKQGPIRGAWNTRGIPRLVLLDDQLVIQDPSISRLTSQEDLEAAIEPLIRQAEARPQR